MYAQAWPSVPGLWTGWTDGKAGGTTFGVLKIPTPVRLQIWARHVLPDCFSRTMTITIKWGWVSLTEGEPSPNVLSSEFSALNSARRGGTACCWQQGGRTVMGSWVRQPNPADLVERGEGWKMQGADSQLSLWKKPWKQSCNVHFSARLKSLLLLIKSP